MPQEEKKLSEIWRLIYRSVRKIQLGDKFDKQLKFESQLNYAELSDDFFFQHMVDLIFQSGVRGVVWKKYEPEIRKEFCGYDMEKVVEFGEKDIQRMLNNPKMFRNRKK